MILNWRSITLSTLLPGNMETLNKTTGFKHNSRRFHRSVICSFHLTTGPRVHIIISRYIHSGGKQVKETVRTKLGFWETFFHHPCPVPDVLLTPWERHYFRNIRKLYLITGIQKESRSSPAAPSEGALLQITTGPLQKLDKPSTLWTLWH